MINSYPVKATTPEVWENVIRILGTGAADPTKEVGPGVTVTRTGTGAYLITWGEAPGTFVTAHFQVGAATPGDVAGHTVIRDTYDASAKTLPFILYNAADAAHDLAANEYIDIVVRFKQTAVS